jgi:hypothetical protein
MKTVRWLLACLILISAFATTAPVAAETATPVVGDRLGKLSRYEISATLNDDGTIDGRERVHFVNATGAVLDEIAFRLYPNAGYYGKGSLKISAFSIDGKTAKPRYSVQSTVVEADFATPLEPGGTAEIDLRFTTTLPMDSTGSYGIFTRHSDTNDWIASDWCPIVAGHDATGWRFDPPSPSGGDPTFSDAAVYSATLTAPSAWILITSGAATKGKASGGMATWTIDDVPLREFTFVASPSLQRFERKVGDHVLAVYLHAGADQAALAKLTLDATESAFSTYDALFGAYPWRELDVIDVRLLGALGVSWTGLLFINGGLLFPHAATDPAPLQFTVAHEVSHQWWGALVGSNTNDHAFLAEGLANCSAVLAVLADQGLAAAKAQLDRQVVQPYLRALAESGDGVVDRPSNAQAAGPPLNVLIYAKAALGFLAIREALGPDAFAAALRAYVADFTWLMSQPADLRAEFQAKSKQNAGPLWTKWFDSDAVAPSDATAVESRFA